MSLINHIVRRQAGLLRCIAALMLLTLISCSNSGKADKRKKPSRRITFWRKDTEPYGAWIAYEGLPYLFPNAEISVNKKDLLTVGQKEGKIAMVFIGGEANLRPSDVTALLNFVGEGNHVFLSAVQFSDTLLRTLDIRLSGIMETAFKNNLRVSVYQPGTNDSMSYAYPGYAFDRYVDSMDTKYTTVLGRDVKGRPNFIRFTYKGGGTLLLHFAPMALSNYFLMHKENMTYYDNVISYIPENVNEVVWDESFRYNNENNFSSLSFIMKNPPLAMAFLLLLILFLLIYFFESKRRQRIVPMIEGLRNTSLDFVKTVGRLYYQRRDNQNLVVKMATYFQDHIRTKYNIPVHLSDPELIDRLSYRTGLTKEFLRLLTGDLLMMQQQGSVSDEELLDLNKKLDEFYKQA